MLYTSMDSIGVDELPEEIAEQCAAVGQFWKDRVREAMDAGILRDFDLDSVSVTMWAHAHGLITLYHRGFLPLSHDEFKQLFRQSGMRMAVGLGSEDTAREIKDALEGMKAQLTA